MHKIGMLVVDDVTLHDMPPEVVAPNQHARAYVQKTKRVQIGGHKGTAFVGFPSKNYPLSISKLEC